MLKGILTFLPVLFTQQYIRVAISSMYFNLYADSTFPVVFPVCIWGIDLILFLFKSKEQLGTTGLAFADAGLLLWLCRSALGVTLSLAAVDRTNHTGLKEAPTAIQALFLLLFFFLLKKVQLERGRLWFLGHTKSFLKAPGTCISRNCLFK